MYLKKRNFIIVVILVIIYYFSFNEYLSSYNWIDKDDKFKDVVKFSFTNAGAVYIKGNNGKYSIHRSFNKAMKEEEVRLSRFLKKGDQIEKLKDDDFVKVLRGKVIYYYSIDNFFFSKEPEFILYTH